MACFSITCIWSHNSRTWALAPKCSRVCSQTQILNGALRVGALRGSDANRFYVRHGFQLVQEDTWDNYYVRPAVVVSQP